MGVSHNQNGRGGGARCGAQVRTTPTGGRWTGVSDPGAALRGNLIYIPTSKKTRQVLNFHGQFLEGANTKYAPPSPDEGALLQHMPTS